jgi:anti-sigma B factor antagonist
MGVDVIVDRKRDATLEIGIVGPLRECAQSLRETVDLLDLRNARRLTIDLGRVPSVTLDEVEVLSRIERRASSVDCAFRLSHPNPSVRAVLVVAGLAAHVHPAPPPETYDWALEADDSLADAANPEGTCRTTDLDGAVLVQVFGEIDLLTAPHMWYAIERAIRRGTPRVILDLSAVTFFGSSGLRVLVDGLRRLRAEQGWLQLVAPSRPVRKILKITGVEEVFPAHDRLEDAIPSTRPAPSLTGLPPRQASLTGLPPR